MRGNGKYILAINTVIIQQRVDWVLYNEQRKQKPTTAIETW